MEEKPKLQSTTHWYRVREHYMKQKKEGLPKMSVVVPTYNQGHVLALTMRSVFSQQNIDVELIIVDAGSDDHTMALIEQRRDNINRVYYVTRYNLPLMINKGVSIATGHYVSILLPGFTLLNRYSLCHIAQVAKENVFPDFIFSANYLTESTYSSFKDAFRHTTDEIQPRFAYAPFSADWLKRGFLPTCPYCMWFSKETFKEMRGLNVGYGFQRSLLDYLCRLHQREDAKVVSTFWSATINDWRLEKKSEIVKDYFGRWMVIFKYFGAVNGLLWPFRKKPFRFFQWLIQSIKSFFKEK